MSYLLVLNSNDFMPQYVATDCPRCKKRSALTVAYEHTLLVNPATIVEITCRHCGKEYQEHVSDLKVVEATQGLRLPDE